MGNKNATPNPGGRGFVQSVTAAVWRPRGAAPPPNNDEATTTTTTTTKDDGVASSSNNVETLPPIKIAAEGENQKEKGGEGDGNTKPTHLRRSSTAGLQVESVLQRKTENLKEFYTLGRQLGQGQFGTTFLCLEKSTGKEYACKSIAKRKLTTEEDVEDVRREIQIMHHLAGHPNVIQIIGAHEDSVAVHAVMELCVGGELFDRIVQRGRYTERKAAELTRVIVGVVQACHSLGVMHRDLKPENFLFIDQKEEAALKTIDFGLSMFFKPGILFNFPF